MRRISIWFIGFFASLMIVASPVSAEEITSYDTVFTIQRDGAVAVRERILYDFGSEERHGIFRVIPVLKMNSSGKKFVLSFSNFSVSDDKGAAYAYSESQKDNEITLKIGNPDVTIRGEHIYDISYLVGGGLTYFSDHDEFYWNITGNKWEVPIASASSRIVLPAEVAEEDIAVTCYTGIDGSTQRACTWTYHSAERTVAVDLTSRLSPYEGLTIVVGFPKGLVARIEPKEYIPFWETTQGVFLLGALIVAAFLWYVVAPLILPVIWWKYGRDPSVPVGVATAWFSAPKGRHGRLLSPGETGTLMDERADNSDITATIIDLARRGYLRIEEKTKGDIHLKKVSSGTSEDTLRPFERTLLEGIFKSKNEITLKTARLDTVVRETKILLHDAVVDEGFFPKNPQSVRTAYTAGSIFALMTGNFLLFLSVLLFGYHMPRKTLSGASAANVARALKKFITSQERQFAFQAERQLLFEKMLPFAVAFGVEKIWIARFAQMHLKSPHWYQGYSSGGRFNALVFADSLHRASSGITHAATPVSSTSGFSSGFSGGSSGGGGGGGGGGSW